MPRATPGRVSMVDWLAGRTGHSMTHTARPAEATLPVLSSSVPEPGIGELFVHHLLPENVRPKPAGCVTPLDNHSQTIHHLFTVWSTLYRLEAMSQKSPNVTLTLPRCSHCGRFWRPTRGLVADAAYCKRCSKDRQAAAATHFGLRPLTAADFTGQYLLPRRLRHP